MHLEASRIQRADVDNFAIPIGSRVIIEPSGLGDKLKTFFIGMERKSYFIVALAARLGLDKMVFDYLYRGNKAKIFYTQDGVINGFMSQVLSYTTSPFRHIYFTYPTAAEICNLRQASRTDCHLPAKLGMGNLHCSGMISNISTTGCGVTVVLPSPEVAEGIAVGSSVTLRFHLVQAMHEFTVPCELKNKRLCGDKLILGMSFSQLEENTRKRVAEFIAWVTEYRL